MPIPNFDFEGGFEQLAIDKADVRIAELELLRSYLPAQDIEDIKIHYAPSLEEFVRPSTFIGTLADVTLTYLPEASTSLLEKYTIKDPAKVHRVSALIVNASCISTGRGSVGRAETIAWYYTHDSTTKWTNVLRDTNGRLVTRKILQPKRQLDEAYVSAINKMRVAPGVLGGSAKGRERHSKPTPIMSQHHQEHEL